MFDFFKGTVTPRDWAFCGVVLAIAIALAALFFLVLHTGQQRKLEALAAQTATLENDLKVTRAYKASSKQNKEMAENIKMVVNTFEKRLPAKRDIIDILRRFEETGNQVFNAKPELIPLPPVPSGSKETIPLRVKAVGDFNQILTFINLLERDTRYFSVSEFDIKADAQGQGLAEAQMTLNTFRFIESSASTEPGKTGKPAEKASGGSTPASAPPAK